MDRGYSPSQIWTSRSRDTAAVATDGTRRARLKTQKGEGKREFASAKVWLSNPCLSCHDHNNVVCQRHGQRAEKRTISQGTTTIITATASGSKGQQQQNKQRQQCTSRSLQSHMDMSRHILTLLSLKQCLNSTTAMCIAIDFFDSGV